MSVENRLQDTLDGGFGMFRKQYVAFILGTFIAVIGSIFIITAPPLFFGVHYMAIQAMKGRKVRVSDVFRGFDYFVVSWVMFLIAFVAIIAGLICLVIPGMLLMVLFQYAVPIAILEKRGGIDSLKRSAEIAWDNLDFSLVLWIFVFIINAVGGALRVGWLITCPYTALCVCLATQALIKKK